MTRLDVWCDAHPTLTALALVGLFGPLLVALLILGGA